jgi:hypothetical protein
MEITVHRDYVSFFPPFIKFPPVFIVSKFNELAQITWKTIPPEVEG